MVEAYKGLDDALVTLRDWNTIIQYWTLLIARQPDNAVAFAERASARFNSGDLAGALADMERACRLGRRPACEDAERIRARLTGR